MNQFILNCNTELYFGSGMTAKLEEMVKRYGNRVLLVYGGGSIKKNGIYDEVIEYLRKGGADIFELFQVRSNPEIGKIEEGIQLCRRNQVCWILGVGGGSVIDTVKAISVGVNSNNLWDSFQGTGEFSARLPFGCVVTVIGSGAEVSRGCVVSKDEIKEKRSLSHDYFRPDFSILVPEYWMSLSYRQLADGAADILSHVFERYFSNLKEMDYSDDLCIATIRCVINLVNRLKQGEATKSLLEELEYASVMAQSGFMTCGRRTDGSCHAIEHALSGIDFSILHTEGIAAVTLAWMKHVAVRNPEKFALLYDRLYGTSEHCSKEEKAERFVSAFQEFYRNAGLPEQLKCTLEKAEIIERVSKLCTQDGKSTLGEYVKLSKQDIEQILSDCLEGEELCMKS